MVLFVVSGDGTLTVLDIRKNILEAASDSLDEDLLSIVIVKVSFLRCPFLELVFLQFCRFLERYQGGLWIAGWCFEYLLVGRLGRRVRSLPRPSRQRGDHGGYL